MNQSDLPQSEDCVLFELSAEVFVYRSTRQETAARYLCRHCFEAGNAVVLRREESVAVIHHVCPQCDTVFLEKRKPLSGLAMSPWG